MTWFFEYKVQGRIAKQALHDGVYTIGKENCNLCLDDNKVSRHHCSLYLNNNILTVVDNSSTNGTFVNGRRIEKLELCDQDELTIGSTIFRFINYVV